MESSDCLQNCDTSIATPTKYADRLFTLLAAGLVIGREHNPFKGMLLVSHYNSNGPGMGTLDKERRAQIFGVRDPASLGIQHRGDRAPLAPELGRLVCARPSAVYFGPLLTQV